MDRFYHFLERVRDFHGDKFDYSKSQYINAKTKILIICPEHGEFYQTPDKHLAKRSKGCQKCWSKVRKGIKRPNLKNKKIPQPEIFLEKANKKYNNKYQYDITEYNGPQKNKIVVICPKHGEFKTTPRNHLIKGNKYGCYDCAREHVDVAKLKTYDDFIEKSIKLHGNKYIYPEENRLIYKNRKSVLIIECKEHGEFKKKAQNHLSGQGCFRCRINKLIEENILTGGYCLQLFEDNPILKNKPIFLYYMELNDGQYYKIGLSKNPKKRCSSIKSLGKLNKVVVLNQIELPSYEAFIIEQTILSEFGKYRLYLNWSKEILSKNIYEEIKHYFSKAV